MRFDLSAYICSEPRIVEGKRGQKDVGQKNLRGQGQFPFFCPTFFCPFIGKFQIIRMIRWAARVMKPVTLLFAGVVWSGCVLAAASADAAALSRCTR